MLDEEALEGNIDENPSSEKYCWCVRHRPNVDQALVVFAIHAAGSNFNLLDRFLIHDAGPGHSGDDLFNKTDLETEAKQEEYRNIYEQAGYPVMFGVPMKSGVDAVRDYLRGKTTILAGQTSGVGKSSLTNLLQPEAAMRLGASVRGDQAGQTHHPSRGTCSVWRRKRISWIRRDFLPCIWKRSEPPGSEGLFPGV